MNLFIAQGTLDYFGAQGIIRLAQLPGTLANDLVQAAVQASEALHLDEIEQDGHRQVAEVGKPDPGQIEGDGDEIVQAEQDDEQKAHRQQPVFAALTGSGLQQAYWLDGV